MTIRVLIADDHPLVRDGLKAALAGLLDVEVVADANQRQLPHPDRGPPRCAAVFTLDGTDHPSHPEQASMIRRCIIWRNRNAHDQRLQQIGNKANLPDTALAATTPGMWKRMMTTRRRRPSVVAVGIEGRVGRGCVVVLAWARREESVGDAPG